MPTTRAAGGARAFAAGWRAAHAGEREPCRASSASACSSRARCVDAVGGLDERFGAGNFEDDDCCLRAPAAGFGCTIARDAFVHHTGSQTFLGQRIDYTRGDPAQPGRLQGEVGRAVRAGADAAPPATRPELVHAAAPRAAAAPSSDAASRERRSRRGGARRAAARPHARRAARRRPRRAARSVRRAARLGGRAAPRATRPSATSSSSCSTHGAELHDDSWLPLYETGRRGAARRARARSRRSRCCSTSRASCSTS